MTTSWKRTETAGGAGAEALCAAFSVSSRPVRRMRGALRWRRDAVCRDASDAVVETGAVSGVPDMSSDSSLTRTNFFSSRFQSQPSTRKETPNTTQEKKGKKTTTASTNSQETRTLA